MTYGDKVYQQLNAMQPGDKIKIDHSLPHAERFIFYAKEYISIHPFGNGIEFNHDKTILKKQKFYDSK